MTLNKEIIWGKEKEHHQDDQFP